MNKQELLRLLQAHVDFPITEDVFDLVEQNSGLDISSENSLLILDEIRKQHEVSLLLQSSQEQYKDDESAFVIETLKYIKPRRNNIFSFNIYSGLRTLSLGLALCFCLLIFSPFMKTEVKNYVAQNTTNKTDYSDVIVNTRNAQIYLESIEFQSSPKSIMLAQEFAQGGMSPYLYNFSTCINCQNLEIHLW